MAVRVEVKATAGWFIGERKQLVFGPVKDVAGNVLDISAWTVQWALMKRPSATEYLLTKSSGAGIGVEGTDTFVVEIGADDLLAMRPNVELYQELKRIDAGNENVLAYGPVTLQLSGIS